MAFLFNKFQEAMKILAKSPSFARYRRQLQFEVNVNRLFLYTCYNRLGRNAEAADAEEIIDMARKASFGDQQKQVQENIHSQVINFCTSMDEILLPDTMKRNQKDEAPAQSNAAPCQNGFSLPVGKNVPPTNHPVIPETRPLNRAEVSQRLKDLIGFTLDLKTSQIPHKEAGQGLFVNGEADVGAVIALYPGVIYTTPYYQDIPGYPEPDAQNPYLITRYDGPVIDANPWGSGGETREVWDGLSVPEIGPNVQNIEKSSDQFSNKPLEGTRHGCIGEVLERRNPLALAHFANHPAKGMVPNVMICPYDFPLTENCMRTYIPDVSFGNEEADRKRLGSFWSKSGAKSSEPDVPVLKTLVLVATRALCDEEVLLNYSLSNSEQQPAWYTSVNEEEA